jgi:hypothetical protein
LAARGFGIVVWVQVVERTPGEGHAAGAREKRRDADWCAIWSGVRGRERAEDGQHPAAGAGHEAQGNSRHGASRAVLCCAVLCCASSMAKMVLKKNGHQQVFNIGKWSNLLR